jgi:hypothetical protein
MIRSGNFLPFMRGDVPTMNYNSVGTEGLKKKK